MNGPHVLPALNDRLLDLPPSATVAINDRSNDLIKAGKAVIKFGLGQSPFPVPDSVVKALQDAAAEKDYLPVQGLPALQDAVAEHHRRFFGISCDPEDVLVGPGSKELMFLLQLAYNGELVLPTPSWVSYEPQAKILGRAISRIPTTAQSRWLLTPELLEEFCQRGEDRPRLLILNYPSNPSGTTYTREELAAIAEVARKRRMLVLSDEIYGKVHHTGEHQSLVPLLPEQTIFSSGLSKWCGAGGWRVGVFVFPPKLAWLRKAMAAVATETFTSTCAPVQFAAVTAFNRNPEVVDYLERSRVILKALGEYVHERLTATGAAVVAPAGGFYVFPDFEPLREQLADRGIYTSAQLCRRLLEDTGVAMLPGSEFGREREELTARIAYVDFDGAAALDAVSSAADSVDQDFINQYCPKIVLGMDKITDWFS